MKLHLSLCLSFSQFYSTVKRMASTLAKAAHLFKQPERKVHISFCLITTVLHWAVPENIHTIPRMAFWNSEGKGGFFELEIRRHGGILTIGMGGF